LQPLISFIFILPANPERIANPAGIVVEKQEIINSWQSLGPSHENCQALNKVTVLFCFLLAVIPILRYG
jgi:hypothetical protein